VVVMLMALGACAGVDTTFDPTPGGADDARPDFAERIPGGAGAWFAEPGEDDGDGDDPDPPNGAELFAADTIHALSIDLSEPALASLRTAPTTEVEATLDWRGEAYTVALRIKGSASLRGIDQKPSFKIDVHHYDPNQEIDGLERLTLNNMIQDGTLAREHTYYWFAARLGLPAPRQGYARVIVNGADYGLYSIIETMDEQLVKRAFPDDPLGNLYEASGADFTRARNWYTLEETSGVVPSPDDIDALVDEVTEATDFHFLMRERFDDRVLTHLALDMVAGNGDGYVFNHHNYLTYYAPFSDVWFLLPWGTDQGFTDMVPPLGTEAEPARGQLYLRCWGDAGCAAELRARAGMVLGIWEAELGDEVERTFALIDAAAQEDPRREKTYAPNGLRDFVAQRPDFLRPYLEIEGP